MAGGKPVKELDQAISEKKEQLKILQAELNALESLKRRISGFSGFSEVTIKKNSRRTSNLKGIVLDMLKEVGIRGLNAGTAVELARQRGLSLERASVSSLLSRLKGDGIVKHEGDVYILKEMLHEEDSSKGQIIMGREINGELLGQSDSSANILPHPAASKGR